MAKKEQGDDVFVETQEAAYRIPKEDLERYRVKDEVKDKPGKPETDESVMEFDPRTLRPNQELRVVVGKHRPIVRQGSRIIFSAETVVCNP